MTATRSAPVEEAGANGHHSGLLTFDDIVAASDIRYEYVDVPEWGGRLKLKSLTGEERGKVFTAIRAHGKQIHDEDEAQSIFYARVIAASAVDEDDKPVIGQKNALALTKKSSSALNRVYKVCARLSGLGDEEIEKAKDDLKRTPSDDTGSD
jgi:hypothetical protein